MRRWRRQWTDWESFEGGMLVAVREQRWRTAGKKRRQPSRRRVGKWGEEGRKMDE